MGWALDVNEAGGGGCVHGGDVVGDLADAEGGEFRLGEIGNFGLVHI